MKFTTEEKDAVVIIFDSFIEEGICPLIKQVKDALKQNKDLVKECIQVLKICSGCDFVSYFANLGKHVLFKFFSPICIFCVGQYE